MGFQIQVVEDGSFNKRLSQFSKGPSSSGCEKAQFCPFGLRRISTFFSNLKLAAIKLNVVYPTSIKPTSITSSFAATTNPNYTLPGLC